MADDKLNILTLAMAKKYTDKSLAGAGAVAGVPCQIQSITPITGGNRITFLWEDNNNVSHTSTLDVMDGAGGEENKIDSISVNGSPISIDENKNVDITVPDAYDDTDIRAELANKSDTDHTHTTVNGHTVESDVPTNAKFTDTVYDDTQVKTQIQAVANGLMDSVGYSADYKTIDIIAKNGVKKSVNVAPIISHASITELSDVDTTNKATGKALVYNATTSKHEYVDVSGTDEKVKMDASTDAKYLGELLDNVTIANENGELKVKKLDGQEVTITEINYLKGLTMNVMDLVNMFSNGGIKIINTPVATYAELLTIDKSSFIEGVSYLVYVLADENHDNAKTTYLVDKVSETPTYFGFADSRRDFTTNPIDLATEITGKLGIANMDSDAIKALFTVDDTYKTATATNNAFSTHGAKALYDELLLAIGNKANSSDLTAHKDDTDIHVSTEDKTKWDSAKTHADSAHAPSNAQENVLETVKVNGTALTPSSKAVNVTVPTKVSELTDGSDYAKKTDIPTTLPANGGNANTVNNHTVKSDVPENAMFTDTIYDDTEVKGSITELNSNLVQLEFGENSGTDNLATIKSFSFIETRESGNGYNWIKLKELAPSLKDGDVVKLSFNGTNINNDEMHLNGTRRDWMNESIITIQESDLNDYLLLYGKQNMLCVYDNIMITKNVSLTEYEPYIPSVKMLSDKTTQIDDLNVLGWVVPDKMSVRNYKQNNVFYQKVDRVNLSNFTWTYNTTNKFWYSTNTALNNMKLGMNIPFVSDYPMTSLWHNEENIIRLYSTSTSSPSGYLYYELAEEKAISIYGNEIIAKMSNSLGGLTFSASGTTLSITDGTHTWTLEANS